jgi:amidase
MTLADDTRWLDATAQAELVRSGQVTPAELVDAAIERIEASNGVLNAVITPLFEKARAAAADRTDARLADGPLRGVPFTIKDLWAASEGDPICNGNAALKAAGIPAAADTTLVARYRAAGLVFVGRTNTPEFGILPTTEPDAWGATHNPWDLTRSPGGSSGGSAAAVASGMVPVSHASDGGGSIRIPASACGLVGLKTSQGRISVGPLRDEAGLGVEHVVSRTVRDCALLLDVSHGPAVGDSLMAPAPVRPYVDEVGADPGRLRIGLLAHNPRGDIDPVCVTAVRDAALLLESLGHHVEEAFPDALADPALATRFAALWSANTGLNVQRVGEALGRPTTADDVEPLTWALAEFARSLSAVELNATLSATALFRRSVRAWWASGFDLLLTPTLAGLPPRLGEMATNRAHPMAPFAVSGALVPFTPAFNVSYQPAINVPLHWTAPTDTAPAGLPVGVHLVADYGREDLLIRVASQLEQASPWAHRHPF